MTESSVKSFHSDINAGATRLKGPPEYDSVEFHEEMIKNASSFYKINSDQKIIGGFWFILEDKENAYLYRIFVDPDYHKKGIGRQVFNFLFNNLPEVRSWSLKTPRWNTRTPKFYSSIGFNVLRKEGDFRFFEKKTVKGRD